VPDCAREGRRISDFEDVHGVGIPVVIHHGLPINLCGMISLVVTEAQTQAAGTTTANKLLYMMSMWLLWSGTTGNGGMKTDETTLLLHTKVGGDRSVLRWTFPWFKKRLSSGDQTLAAMGSSFSFSFFNKSCLFIRWGEYLTSQLITNNRTVRKRDMSWKTLMCYKQGEVNLAVLSPLYHTT
jgi:hypothetical protein